MKLRKGVMVAVELLGLHFAVQMVLLMSIGVVLFVMLCRVS